MDPPAQQELVDEKKLPPRKSLRRSVELPRWPILFRRIIWTTMIAIATALGSSLFTYVWQRYVAQVSIDYEIDVRQGDLQGIPLADVDVNLGINGVASKKTDAFGKAIFEGISSLHRGQTGQISLHKEGFEAPEDAHKIKIANISKLQDESSPLILFMVPSNKTESEPQTRSVPMDTSPAEIRRVYTSGPMLSGRGSKFSDWYKLCSDHIPGYHIVSDTFTLTGDRTCNQWSSCERDPISSPQQVCYKFRMQGHGESVGPLNGLISNGNTGQAASTGVLEVLLQRDSVAAGISKDPPVR